MTATIDAQIATQITPPFEIYGVQGWVVATSVVAKSCGQILFFDKNGKLIVRKWSSSSVRVRWIKEDN